MDAIIYISDEEEEELLAQARLEDVGSDQEKDEGDETASRKYAGDSDDSVELAPPNGGGWQRDPRHITGQAKVRSTPSIPAYLPQKLEPDCGLVRQGGDLVRTSQQ